MKNLVLLLAVFIGLSGCAAPQKPKQIDSNLRAIQNRTFETDRNVAFASVLSEFQDLGYVIGSADINAGLITASSPIKKVGNIFYPFFNVEATALIEELGAGQTRVRLNFINVRSKGLQSIKEKEVVSQAEIYNEAFTNIQQGILSRSNTNQQE